LGSSDALGGALRAGCARFAHLDDAGVKEDHLQLLPLAVSAAFALSVGVGHSRDEDVARVQVAVDKVVDEDHLGHRVHAEPRELLARVRVARLRLDEARDRHARLEGLDEQVARREVKEWRGDDDRLVVLEVAVEAREVARLLAQVELPKHLERKVLHHVGQREPLERRDERERLRDRAHDVNVNCDNPIHARVDHLDSHVHLLAGAARVDAAAVDLGDAARADHLGRERERLLPVRAHLPLEEQPRLGPRVRRHVVVQLLKRAAELDGEEVVARAGPLGELDVRRPRPVHRAQRVRPQRVLDRRDELAEDESKRKADHERRGEDREAEEAPEHAERAEPAWSLVLLERVDRRAAVRRGRRRQLLALGDDGMASQRERDRDRRAADRDPSDDADGASAQPPRDGVVLERARQRPHPPLVPHERAPRPEDTSYHGSKLPPLLVLKNGAESSMRAEFKSTIRRERTPPSGSSGMGPHEQLRAFHERLDLLELDSARSSTLNGQSVNRQLGALALLPLYGVAQSRFCARHCGLNARQVITMFAQCRFKFAYRSCLLL
jgi:hypothetical protein